MAKRVGVDKWIFFTTLLLVVVGLAMVFSASAVVAQEQYHTPYASVGTAGGVGPCRRAVHGRAHARRLHALQFAAVHLPCALCLAPSCW